MRLQVVPRKFRVWIRALRPPGLTRHRVEGSGSTLFRIEGSGLTWFRVEGSGLPPFSVDGSGFQVESSALSSSDCPWRLMGWELRAYKPASKYLHATLYRLTRLYFFR